MDIEKIIEGSVCDIFAIVIKGVCLVREYITGLEKTDQKQLFALFELICHTGPPHNKRNSGT